MPPTRLLFYFTSGLFGGLATQLKSRYAGSCQARTPFHATISYLQDDKFLVSKETVVLRRWERSKQKFGFIKRVDKGEITTVKDLES